MFDEEVGVTQPHSKESRVKTLLLSAFDARAVRDTPVALSNAILRNKMQTDAQSSEKWLPSLLD